MNVVRYHYYLANPNLANAGGSLKELCNRAMDTEDVDALSSDSEDDTGEEQKLSGEIQKLILEVLVLLAHVA